MNLAFEVNLLKSSFVISFLAVRLHDTQRDIRLKIRTEILLGFRFFCKVANTKYMKNLSRFFNLNLDCFKQTKLSVNNCNSSISFNCTDV